MDLEGIGDTTIAQNFLEAHSKSMTPDLSFIVLPPGGDIVAVIFLNVGTEHLLFVEDELEVVECGVWFGRMLCHRQHQWILDTCCHVSFRGWGYSSTCVLGDESRKVVSSNPGEDTWKYYFHFNCVLSLWVYLCVYESEALHWAI